MAVRLVTGWAALLIAGAILASCGGMRAPSLGLPGDAVTAPANPQMGKVVNGAYTVAPGDTLATISERTNTPIRALIDNNGLQPPFNLRAGQELRISERQTYIVQAGDTLGAIARRHQVSQSALVDLNDLEPPFLIRVGQSLTLPSTLEAPQQTMVAQQPIEAAPVGQISSAPLPSSGSATPASGAAAPAGAKPFSPDPIASSPTTLVPATNAPASTATASVPAEPDLSAAEEAAEKAYEESQQTQQQAAAPSVPTVSAATPTPPAPVQSASVAPAIGPASASGFSWPVQGKVIAKFGATADGLRNDGINIAAPAGAPVMAAADGTVAYAGNQLRGFGNLILVRHETGLITAYAHNQSMLVEKGAKVKRGDMIARVGSTGSVDKPQLHFEIRKGEQAVDPMKYLGGGA